VGSGINVKVDKNGGLNKALHLVIVEGKRQFWG